MVELVVILKFCIMCSQ